MSLLSARIQSGMDENRKSRLPIVAIIVVAACSLPALYVMAVGPINWLFYNGYLQEGQPVANLVMVFYRPLEWGMQNSDGFKHVMDWYVALWV